MSVRGSALRKELRPGRIAWADCRAAPPHHRPAAGGARPAAPGAGARARAVRAAPGGPGESCRRPRGPPARRHRGGDPVPHVGRALLGRVGDRLGHRPAALVSRL